MENKELTLRLPADVQVRVVDGSGPRRGYSSLVSVAIGHDVIIRVLVSHEPRGLLHVGLPYGLSGDDQLLRDIEQAATSWHYGVDESDTTGSDAD